MRSLGYFNLDSTHSKAVHANSSEDLKRSYLSYCHSNQHSDYGVYIDSGSGGSNSAWSRMIEFIHESRAGYLIVIPGSSHLGKTLEEQVGKILELDAISCEVICADYEFPDPLQNALRGSNAAALRREKIKEGMKAKAAKGLGLGKPPYGYRIGADGSFRLVPEQAKVIELIFKKYLSSPDGGVRTIASALNDEGIRTRTGNRWSMVTIRDILRNTAYIGTYRRFGLRIPGSYQPIVTPEEFRNVQDKMQRLSHGRGNSKAPPYLLSGIVFCAHCEQRMMGVTRKQNWRRKDGERSVREYRYYQCQSRINRNQCDYRTVKADVLEEQAILILHEKLLSGDEGIADESGTWVADQKARSHTQLKALDKRLIEGVQRAASGSLTLSQLRNGMLQLSNAKKVINDRINSTSHENSRDTIMKSNGQKFLNEWGSLNDQQKRELIKLLVNKVKVLDGLPELVLA